jgi:hypothetical protein
VVLRENLVEVPWSLHLLLFLRERAPLHYHGCRRRHAWPAALPCLGQIIEEREQFAGRETPPAGKGAGKPPRRLGQGGPVAWGRGWRATVRDKEHAGRFGRGDEIWKARVFESFRVSLN